MVLLILNHLPTTSIVSGSVVFGNSDASLVRRYDFCSISQTTFLEFPLSPISTDNHSNDTRPAETALGNVQRSGSDS